MASDARKKERWPLPRFGGLGFDVDKVDNDAARLFIVFILGE